MIDLRLELVPRGLTADTTDDELKAILDKDWDSLRYDHRWAPYYKLQLIRAMMREARRHEPGYVQQATERPKYGEYMKSVEWRARADWYLSHANSTCADCGGKATHVHHLSYDRLGCEADEDLICLCWHCHETRHGRQFSKVSSSTRRDRNARQSLRRWTWLPPR